MASLLKSAPIVILMADDDEDDQVLVQKSIDELESAPLIELRFVNDGEELLNYLYHRDEFSDAKEYPSPSILLLDLNMPKKNGYAALAEIRNDPQLSQLPIIVLTTSRNEDDIDRSYTLGANAFISKNTNYNDFKSVMETVYKYWFKAATVPV